MDKLWTATSSYYDNNHGHKIAALVMHANNVHQVLRQFEKLHGSYSANLAEVKPGVERNSITTALFSESALTMLWANEHMSKAQLSASSQIKLE